MFDIRRDDLEFILNIFENRIIRPPDLKVSEYAAQHRILPSNTPFPGLWDNRRTPYLVEIMDNMSCNSRIQHTVFQKAAQIGATSAAENVVAYYIGAYPAEILYVSATEPLLKKWARKRLEPLVESCGLRDIIFAQYKSKALSRSGDATFSKEFFGGSLDLVSAQSAASLRSESKRVLIRDEIDGAPSQLRTGEGNWLDVSFARTFAWRDRKKVLDLSTPSTFEDSEIHKQFLRGDQRRYFVPCPCCGKFQPLEWTSETSNHGMRADTQGGQVTSVYYLCQFCHEAFFDRQKSDFLGRGRWEPASTSESEFMRSYHLNALYSPIGMLSWEEVYRAYLKAQKTPDGMRSFINLYLGEPYKETGTRPKVANLIELKGLYAKGTVPAGVLFVTMGVDVQRGKIADSRRPARLEFEVCGHGPGYRTFSIDYRVIEGAVDDPYSGAWESLHEMALAGGLTFKRADGLEFSPVIILIDSGDGFVTDVVYRFCARWRSTFPSKGFVDIKEDIDKQGNSDFLRYRSVKLTDDLMLYKIATSYYKTHTYNNLRIRRRDLPPQKPGFCEFPSEYTQDYFEMLSAEEKREDKSFYLPPGRRNEALDCRVLNLTAADIYLDLELAQLKAAFQKQGVSKEQLEVLSRRAVVDVLKKKAGVVGMDN